MKNDPAIERTRDARRRISASVADDPTKMVNYYIQMQNRFSARLRPGPVDVRGGAGEQGPAADARKDAQA